MSKNEAMEETKDLLSDMEVYSLLRETEDKFKLADALLPDSWLDNNFIVTQPDAYNWDRPVTLVLNTK